MDAVEVFAEAEISPERKSPQKVGQEVPFLPSYFMNAKQMLNGKVFVAKGSSGGGGVCSSLRCCFVRRRSVTGKQKRDYITKIICFGFC